MIDGSMRMGITDLRRRDRLLVAPWLGYVDQAKHPALIAAFKTVPGISMVTTSDTGVGDVGNNNADNLLLAGRTGSGPAVRRINVGSDFFRLFGAKAVAGRLLDDVHRMDDTANGQILAEHGIVIGGTQRLHRAQGNAPDLGGQQFGTDQPVGLRRRASPSPVPQRRGRAATQPQRAAQEGSRGCTALPVATSAAAASRRRCSIASK